MQCGPQPFRHCGAKPCLKVPDPPDEFSMGPWGSHWSGDQAAVTGKGWFPQSPLEGRGPSGGKPRRQEFCRRCTASQVQKGMASGEDVFDSKRIINTLCIQAEQKLFAIPAEICFHRSLVPLHLITPAKRTSLSKSSSGDSTQFPVGQAGGTGGVSFPTCWCPL